MNKTIQFTEDYLATQFFFDRPFPTPATKTFLKGETVSAYSISDIGGNTHWVVNANTIDPTWNVVNRSNTAPPGNVTVPFDVTGAGYVEPGNGVPHIPGAGPTNGQNPMIKKIVVAGLIILAIYGILKLAKVI